MAKTETVCLKIKIYWPFAIWHYIYLFATVDNDTVVRTRVTQARDDCECPEQPGDEAGPDQVVEPVQSRLVAVQRAWDS